jgi:signal transduction histidine kinase
MKTIELKNANKAEIDQLLELISIFVHDLESPLVVMQTILKLLDNNRLDLSNKHHIDLIQSSKIATDRARSIIGDLLQVSRSGQLGLPVNPEEVPICSTLKNSVAMILPAARENSIAVKLTCPESEFDVVADPALLARVIDNLLYNAIRHSPPDSTVSVALFMEDNMVRVRIIDQGDGFTGIDPNKLFDKYSQLKLRQEGKHKGVGLGLFFCSQSIIAMNGKIWACNSPDGGGEFNFTLEIKG